MTYGRRVHAYQLAPAVKHGIGMINRAVILVLDELTAENAASGLTQKNTIIASGVAAGHF